MAEEESVLRRYVPNVVIARYMNNSTALTAEEMRSFNAAMGFFDISGFSALASALRNKKVQATRRTILSSMSERRMSSSPVVDSISQQQQPMRSVTTAPEELTAKLNNALENVIKVVVKYHGDVIKVGIKRYLILK